MPFEQAIDSILTKLIQDQRQKANKQTLRLCASGFDVSELVFLDYGLSFDPPFDPQTLTQPRSVTVRLDGHVVVWDLWEKYGAAGYDRALQDEIESRVATK